MIRPVDAPDDPRIARYARVGDHQWLAARGLFVAEGRLLVERLFDAGRYEVDSVLVTPAALAALHARLSPLPADVFVAAPPVLNAVTGFNFHRGCLALARRPAPLPLDAVISGQRLLILEAVGNPDNVGGLFRTAAALGCGGLLLDGRSADPFYRKALRTSMGAALRVPFTRVEGWSGAFARLRERGFRVLALTPDPAARSLTDAAASVPRDARIALMVGAEGSGLSAAAFAATDERVRIPIAEEVDSLNVVVAAALALYAFGPSA